MAQLCLVGYTYRGYEMAYALEQAKALGYSGIELRSFSDIDLSAPAGVVAALAKAGELAGPLGLAIHSLFYSPLPISRAQERVDEERAFAEVMCILAEHQVPILHTRLSLQKPDGTEVVSSGARAADYESVRRTLERLIPIAEEHRVRIAIETHMGTIHDTAASQLAIVSAHDSGYLTGSLDFANMLIAHREEALVETIRSFGPRIGYVHIKNVKLLPLGYDWNLPVRWGDINYYLVLKALKEARYQGPLAVEYCGTGDPDVFAADDADYLRGLIERLGL